MTLASDTYDPDTGLDHGGDAGLHVEFYDKKVVIAANPEIGRLEPLERMEVYCRIVVPGDKNFTHDQPVRDHDKARFPRHWMAFQMKNAQQGAAGFGTSLDEWSQDEPSIINENQRVELFHLGFQTAEQVAMATDAQIQRMPMGAVGLRLAARRYLQNKSKGNADGKQEAMEAQIANLTAMVEKLSNPTAVAIRRAVADVVPLDPTIPPAPRKPRGPNKIKRKAPVRTRNVEHAAAAHGASHG